MADPVSPWTLAALGGALSSLGGLAALLRAGKRITTIQLISSALNSGVFGTALVLVWYNYFRDNIWVLIGIAGLAGLGGMTLIDFCVQALKAWLVHRIDND